MVFITALQNLSTVAGLLATATSALLALTANISSVHGDSNYSLWVATNCLWVISLILAVACAIWCQLACLWIRQPHGRIFWFVGDLTIRWFPVALLLGASITSSSGLICLAFSLFPNTPVPIITCVLIGLIGILATIIMWWWVAEWAIPPLGWGSSYEMIPA